MNENVMNLRSPVWSDRGEPDRGDPGAGSLQSFLAGSGKVLFVASPVYDYLSDGVYHGLTELLGRDRVVDHPRQERYHIPNGSGPDTKYPMLNFVDPAAASSTATDPIDVRSFDVIVIGRLHASMFPVLRKVLRLADRNRTVFLDGMDDPFVRGWMRRKVGVYFKRELLRPSLESWIYAGSKIQLGLRQNLRFARDWMSRPIHNQGTRFAMCGPRLSGGGILPLPFGLVDVGYSPPVVEKEYDIAFIGTLTSPRRRQVLSVLENWNTKRNLRLLVKITDRLSWRQYLDVLSRTRICLNVRGEGIDTYRYWEIPYTGSLLLSEEPLIQIPNNFEEGKHAFFFSFDTLQEKLDRILDDTGVIERVANAGREHVMRYHTTVSRATTVLTEWQKSVLAP